MTDQTQDAPVDIGGEADIAATAEGSGGGPEIALPQFDLLGRVQFLLRQSDIALALGVITILVVLVRDFSQDIPTL